MKSTLLRQWHEAAGARFAPFAGYEMPVQFPLGAVEEHRLCRRSLGFFDVDHMGRFIVSGGGAGEALSSLVSSRILDLKNGEARYALLLNEAGGIIDDLLIYKMNEENVWLIVVNAVNREIDYAYLKERLAPNIGLSDVSGETYMISLQGPEAIRLLGHVSGGSVSGLPRSSMTVTEMLGTRVRLARTGYTGEDGAELFYDAARARELWEGLLDEARKLGIEAGPVGLAARDSLRFEAGMPLYGHEITAGISPLEALLSWACDLEKEFTGKAALLEQKEAGIKRKLATVNIKGGVPRQGYTVHNEAGEEIGVCVSGMFCPSSATYSANVLIPPLYAKVGANLGVSVRGNIKNAVVVKRPLYEPVYRRKLA